MSTRRYIEHPARSQHGVYRLGPRLAHLVRVRLKLRATVKVRVRVRVRANQGAPIDAPARPCHLHDDPPPTQVPLLHQVGLSTTGGAVHMSRQLVCDLFCILLLCTGNPNPNA